MGCGISRLNEESDVKDIRSFSSRDSCKPISQLLFPNVALFNLVLNNRHNHDHENGRRLDERDPNHREKEKIGSQSRGPISDKRKPDTTVEEEIPQMKEMTEEDYAIDDWREGDAERYDELRMELDLMREVQEVERENEMMEREMKGIENEKAYEGKFREGGGNGWEIEDYEMSPDMRFHSSDDRSYYSDVSSMSSMLSVLHESPDES
ncbi:hypothetical protein CJF32_00009933 [Rutstroemia sp. NJR-2017a WRK4]|nr:hypothetical protein CJF32_00009933 [Rutstroemia sp. NJR-2017a WRK4]